MPRKPASSGERFQIGDYYLDTPHPDHGGIQYACRYDPRTRAVRRRSLGTADEGEAKKALARLVATAPQGSGETTATSDRVLTLAVFEAYLDAHGARIKSEEVANRAVFLFSEYMRSCHQLAAPVSYWTEARQVECAKWLHKSYDHAPGYIERLFNVMRAAFFDGTKIKIRRDALGHESECAMIATAPDVLMYAARVARELSIAAKRPRPHTPSLDRMASVLDAIKSEHLFRFAILSLTTWARPEAITDFDPWKQCDWNVPAIDLAPVGWVPTKKRRAQQPMTQCLADWLVTWMAEKDATYLLRYKAARVRSTKQAWRRIGRDLEIAGFTQKSFRHFMADTCRTLFRRVPREQRSLWLAHTVEDGSRTTGHYEGSDPLALADVALATDCIMSLLAERCSRKLFAIDVRLNRDDLLAIGARQIPKNAITSDESGGRDRDRTCDPYHVKVIDLASYLGKSKKRRA